MVKNLPARARNIRASALIRGSGRSPGGSMAPTPVLLPGKSHGQGSPWATVRGVAKAQTRLRRLNTKHEIFFLHMSFFFNLFFFHLFLLVGG